jgi:hypothetical protein
MFRHLCAYELASIVDEGQEGAFAVHLVNSMLNKRVERNIAARNWFWWEAGYNIERIRGSG